MAGPPSELMALSLALAPACWQCLALLAEAVFPSCHACRALFHYRKRKRALSTVCSVHSSQACHDREAAGYGCPSGAWTGWNRAEQPPLPMPGTAGEGRKQWCHLLMHLWLFQSSQGLHVVDERWKANPTTTALISPCAGHALLSDKTSAAAQTTIKCVY